MSVKLLITYILGVIVLVGALVLLGSSTTTKLQTYTASDAARPIATVETNQFDFGAMTNQDIKSTKFTIQNTGQNDLALTNVSTSCDCTYAYLRVGDTESPRFTMHGTKDWSASVPANTSAELEVIYEPAIMPVQGQVSRTVTVATNDPEHPTLTFTVTANVTS
ncbi:MAG: DUF1573 domain-containing protein [Patescibacteria group bacterium]